MKNRPRLVTISRFCFTLFASLTLCSVAYADRVALYPATGAADDARRTEVTHAIAAQLAALHHEIVTDGALARPGNAGTPDTRGDMLAAAAANRAQWTLTADVTPLPGQYRLHLRAAYLPNGRMEEIDVNVVEMDEEARLRDVLSALVRAQGLGADLLRLTGDPAAAQRAELERQRQADEEARRQEAQRQQQEAENRAIAEQRQREAAERARQELQAQQRADAERQAAQRAAEQAQQRSYGDTHHSPWIVSGGFGVTGLVVTPTAGRGGAMGDVRARLGYSIPQVQGLEPRIGIDVMFGSSSSVNLVAGATYLATLYRYGSSYLAFGGGLEMGAFFSTSGSRDPYFLARFAANLAWSPIEHLVLEASAPEVTYLSVGAVGLGFSIRAGYRF